MRMPETIAIAGAVLLALVACAGERRGGAAGASGGGDSPAGDAGMAGAADGGPGGGGAGAGGGASASGGAGQGGSEAGASGGAGQGGGGAGASGGAGAGGRAGQAGGGETNSSVEVGRTKWGPDHAVRSDPPQGGTLLSVWTRIPDPGPAPWSRGNMDVYVLRGAGWYLRCLVGNSTAQSATNARYNANSMLFANPGDTWVADYSYYESTFGHPEAPYRGWVWVAWQVVVADGAFTIRQWLKLGVDGPVFAAGESAPTFAEVRAILVQKGWSQAEANAWTPSDATSFQIGSDHGYLCRARMEARSTRPTLAELDQIARRSAADPSAWADYRLSWAGGGPDLSDRSGHGRDLTLERDGVLYEGPPGPDL